MLTRLTTLLLCSTLSGTAWAQVTTTTSVEFLHPTYETSFIWQGRQQGTYLEKHAALLIPVKLPSSTRLVYMQLDTGAPRSMLYSGELTQLQQSATGHFEADYEIYLGKRKLRLKRPVIRQTMPQREPLTDPVIIGTLGTDLLDHKVLVIDYPNQRLSLMDTLTDDRGKQVRWAELIYERGSLLLPAVVHGKSTLLYFDTGSSSFDLLTDPATWSSLAAKDSISSTYPVQSWERTLTAHTVAAKTNVQLAGQQLPLRSVSYIDGASDSQIGRMMALGIGGMTGNKLFLQSVLFIDASRKRYGFLQK